MLESSKNDLVSIYKPLLAKELRLLTLISTPSGQQDEPIYVSLKTYNIDNSPPYLALSYCWGESGASASIYVDGSELIATRNLYRVFHYLKIIQGLEKADHWWIDAVCINQLDLEERKAQVLMMRDIFSSAARVVIWLGEPDADERNPLEYVENLMCMNTPTAGNSGHADTRDIFAALGACRPPKATILYEALDGSGEFGSCPRSAVSW